MDNTVTRLTLMARCKQLGIKGYSGKKKEELLRMLASAPVTVPVPVPAPVTAPVPAPVPAPCSSVARLNYIGSKYQLLEWLTQTIQEKTGWTTDTWKEKTIADLFSGTGIVSYHFRSLGARIISNDAERYSSIISRAFTCSTWSDTWRLLILQLQSELDQGLYSDTIGYITRHYSPYDGNERKFFTVDNGQRIDYLRKRIEELSEDEKMDDSFLLASLLVSADAISNVPAVYGCFLKEFKAKALKPLVLRPLHLCTVAPVAESVTYCSDVLSSTFLHSFRADIVYLDPPYNERQYSKNYFPLNMIAKSSSEKEEEAELKGKTGIPRDCFLSPFCKKGVVEEAFDKVFREVQAEWIFMSYNSESLVPKEKLLEQMGKYGTVSVVERDYKRFKSFEYNQDVAIKEFLFCLHKNPPF